MKEKIKTFVDNHGYSMKAYCLSLLVFPPASHYIACKKPGWSPLKRVIANLGPIVIFILLTFVVIPIFQRVYEAVISISG